MEIRFNDNKKVVDAIRQGLEKKNGHCPAGAALADHCGREWTMVAFGDELL